MNARHGFCHRAQGEVDAGVCRTIRDNPCRAFYLAIALSLLMLAATHCSQPMTPPAPVLLRLAGSTSMQPLLRELTTAYSARYQHVSFEFYSVGSTAGLEMLRRGSADLALVSRTLQPEEEQDLSTGKRIFTHTAIARDAITVIVNEKNPLHDLSLYQLRNIFEGQTLTWKELGSPMGDIVVVSREDGSGTRSAFEELVMRGHHVTPAALVMPGSEAVRQYVAQHGEAIGYLSNGWLGPGVAPLAIDGVLPEQQTIEQGAYPLTRSFLLIYRIDASPEVTRFVQFVSSPSGQAIVKRTYGGGTR